MSAGQLTSALGTVAAGASASVVLNGAVPASTTSGTIINMISHVASTDGNDGNDGNDTPADGGSTVSATDTHQIDFTPFADLSLSKTVDR